MANFVRQLKLRLSLVIAFFNAMMLYKNSAQANFVH